MELHPLEVRVLLHCRGGEEVTHARLVVELGYNQGQANQSLSWLAAKGYAEERSRVRRVLYELTEMGREAITKGTIEERILDLLKAEGGLTLPEIAAKLGVEAKDVGSAFGALAKDGAVAMDAEKRAGRFVSARRRSPRALQRNAARPGACSGWSSVTR
jgi:phenylalanyl-tRNA synthetase alpha chain